MPHTVAVLVGSIRKGSINQNLAKALANLGKDKLEFRFVNIGDLPHYNEDLWQDGKGPDAVEALKKTVAEADGVLLITPEYNRAVPGMLGNALDWGSRPYGKSSWRGKPAACCGASPGAIGTAAAQVHLKSHMVTLGLIPMGVPELYLSYKADDFGADGTVTNESTRNFLQSYIDAFAEHVAQHAAK